MYKVIVKITLIFIFSACSRTVSPSRNSLPEIKTSNLPEAVVEITIPQVDIDPLSVNVAVDAGHMEIVGDENIIPS